ncbi:ABC transporter ATP-binding protein [Novacetimonas cocois]|nr:ABC transporter ATP-binding protein [Novacetimonas cocois]
MTTSAMTGRAPAITLRGLGLSMDGQWVFRNLEGLFPAGRLTVLLGGSGIGKTTLLRLMAGLLSPTTGEVAADDGLPLTGRVGWMGQNDMLLPWARVEDNVMLGSRLRGEAPDRARARGLLEQVGLAQSRAALPASLSGGMRQRVALARVLYEGRPVVLMDEPFSALDSVTRLRMHELAARMLSGCTTILITHDPLEACRMGQALFMMGGDPVRLSALPVPGDAAIPRAVDDPALLAAQADLWRRMMAA